MSVGAKKAAFGMAATIVLLAIALPTGYWFLIRWIDNAFGVGPILSAPVSLILAAAAILIGLFWITWAYSYLVFVGGGLPFEFFGRALLPTQTLVTTGPYAYTRNPMAIGELFVLLGAAFLAGSPSGLVLVPIIALLYYLYLAEFEENALLKRFGADYEEYRRNVPALVPRASAYVHQPITS